MKRMRFTIWLALAAMPAFAQRPQQADSLRKALHAAGSDTARAHTYLRLAEFEIFKPGALKADLDSAAAYINQAKAIKTSDAEVVGHNLMAEAALNKEKGQKETAKALAQKAIQTLEKSTDKYLLGQAYMLSAELYDFQNSTESVQKNQLLEKAAGIFAAGHYVEREATCYRIMSDIDPMPQSALDKALHALALYKSIHYNNMQAVLDAVGIAYYATTDYAKSLEYEMKALETAKANGDTTMQLCEINNHIGLVYYLLSDYKQALNYFKAAIVSAEAHHDVPTIYMIISNVCDCYMKLKQPADMVKALQAVINKYPVPKGDVVTECYVAAHFLQSYVALKQYNLAQPYADHLAALIDENKVAPHTLSIFYLMQLWYLFETKQYAGMLQSLQKADTVAKRYGVAINVASIQKWWYRMDTAQQNYKDAFAHLLQNKQINDSMFTEAKTKEIEKLRVQFNVKEKETQITLLNQGAALDKSKLQQASLQRNVIIGAGLLALIIAVLLYRQSRMRKQNNQLITRKNKQLQNLVTEKEWLLKEVHHRVKNNLHSVICLLEAQAAYLEDDALAAVKNSRHRIYTMSLIHQKLYQADDIKTIDMSTYIPELVMYLRDSFGIGNQVHFNVTVAPIHLNPSQAIPLALIINEALTNCIKYAFPHGQSGEVVVSLTQDEGKYKLVLADNGVGMPGTPDLNKNSLGMELMKGLSKEIGGSITFENKNGLKISIVFERDLLHTMDSVREDYLAAV